MARSLLTLPTPKAAIVRLNHEAASLVDTEALARILLRGSPSPPPGSKGWRSVLADSCEQKPRGVSATTRPDITVVEVLGNIDAMVCGIKGIGADEEITVDLLLAIHQSLLARTRLQEYGGKFREQQNWIGGNAHNPCTAAFIPPPPELVPDFVSDLVAFSNDDSLPVVAEAAIAHSQFETIHPFVDGNGRTGRALIHLILRRRGIAPRGPAAGLSHPCHLGAGLHRWPRRYSVPRTQHL